MAKSFLITLVASFFLLEALSIKEAAQATSSLDKFSLGIFPPILEINADPPADVQANITIQNLSNTQQNLSITARPFRLSEAKDGTIRYLPEAEIQELDLFILEKVTILDQNAPVESIAIDPFESRTLTLALDLDSKTPVGDYYFSIIFTAGKSQSSEISSSQTTGGIATNVILSVGKKGTALGEIKKFSAPWLVIGGPVPITLLLSNNSNHYIVPTGRIIIRDMFGRDLGSISLLPQYVLAKSSRFMIDSDQASPSAEFSKEIEQLNLEHPALIWPKKFLFGLYTVDAHIKLSDNGPTFETKTRFMAIPVYAVFAFSFIAFVVISIYLRVKRKI